MSAQESRLTERDKRYLKQMQSLPATLRYRMLGWCFELGPSIALFIYGFVKNARLFMALGFLSLLYFAVWRMVGQLRGARMLRRIIESRVGFDDQPTAKE